MSSPYLGFIEETMRLKRFRQSTIKNYLQWIKRYILFHHKKHPKEMHDDEVQAFLSYLTNSKNVAPSTQPKHSTP